MEFNFKLEGYINKADVSIEDFADEFSEWLESKGWGYTGKIGQVYEDENVLEYMEKIAENKDGVFLVCDDDSSDDEENSKVEE